MTFDEIRAAYPGFGLAVYAYEPGTAVTLEVLPKDGGAPFTFTGPTLQSALDRAFPPEPDNSEDETCPNTGLPCLPSCDRKSCAGLHVPLNEWPEPDETPEPPASVFD